MYGYDRLISSLREALEDAETKDDDLRGIRENIDEALETIEEYKNNLEAFIEQIEGLNDLEASYQFYVSLEDIDLRPSL